MTSSELIERYHEGSLNDTEKAAFFMLLATDGTAREEFSQHEILSNLMQSDRARISVPSSVLTKINATIDGVVATSSGLTRHDRIRSVFPLFLLCSLSLLLGAYYHPVVQVVEASSVVPATPTVAARFESRTAKRSSNISVNLAPAISTDSEPAYSYVTPATPQVFDPVAYNTQFFTRPTISEYPTTDIGIEHASSTWTASVQLLRSYSITTINTLDRANAVPSDGFVLSVKKQVEDQLLLSAELGREYYLQKSTQRIPNSSGTNILMIANPITWAGVGVAWDIPNTPYNDIIQASVGGTIGLSTTGPMLRAGVGLHSNTLPLQWNLGLSVSTSMYSDLNTWYAPINLAVTFGVGVPL